MRRAVHLSLTGRHAEAAPLFARLSECCMLNDPSAERCETCSMPPEETGDDVREGARDDTRDDAAASQASGRFS